MWPDPGVRVVQTPSPLKACKHAHLSQVTGIFMSLIFSFKRSWISLLLFF